MTWLAATGGYQVTLVSGQVMCRNAKGKALKAVPPALKDDPTVFGLRQLNEWLSRHEAQVRDQVDRWMVRSLPVPAGVLSQVWADEVWRTALTDLVVTVDDDADEVGCPIWTTFVSSRPIWVCGSPSTSCSGRPGRERPTSIRRFAA
jgi:hypothetical protein